MNACFERSRWYGVHIPLVWLGLFTNRSQTVDWVIVEQRLPDWYQLKQTIYITVMG